MLSTLIKRYDFYGQNLSINFQKKSTHQTLLGGILSLLARIVLMYYALSKIIQCAKRDDPTITSTQKLLDIKGRFVDLETSGFEIIVGFRAKNNKIIKLPNSIGHVDLTNAE